MSIARGRSWAVIAAFRAVVAVEEAIAAFILSGDGVEKAILSPDRLGTGLRAYRSKTAGKLDGRYKRVCRSTYAFSTEGEMKMCGCCTICSASTDMRFNKRPFDTSAGCLRALTLPSRADVAVCDS